MQKLILLVCVAVAFTGTGAYVWLVSGKAKAPGGINLGLSKSKTNSVAKDQEKEPVQYDIDSPASLTAVINKTRPLPINYQADDLYSPGVPLRQSPNTQNMLVRRVMEADLKALVAAAKAAGSQLVIGSAYRSADTQRSLYDGYVRSSGQATADLTSARPGHSEHQTGLAIDFTNAASTCFLETCFADTKEGTWLAANAHGFGFILRYPLHKTPVTGYSFEPWHYRYVGNPLASQIHVSGQTLEEFFGLPKAPHYNP